MYIHWMKLRKQQNWIFSFFLVLSNILSCEASSASIIRYIVQGSEVDFFSFTDDGICGLSQGTDEWCKGKNAHRVSSAGIGNFRPTHSCTCQCKNNKKTFVFEKKECVNILYLENRDDFGKGHYLFTTLPINLQNGPSSFSTNKRCPNCIVCKVMYFMRSKWHEISQKWNISIDGVLSTEPGTNPKDASGKILKIQLRDCTNWRGKTCNSWGSKNPLIFFKSIGNYTVNVSPTTFPSSTLAPMPALITSQNLMTSPSEQRNTYTRYISTRTEITQQVSTATSDTVNVGPTTILSSTLAPTPALITSQNLMTSPSEQGNACTRYSSTRTEITQQVLTAPVILVSPAWDSISSEIFPKSTSAVIQYSTTSKPGNDNALDAEVSSSVGAIVGSIVACIVLMAVIVFCFVWKRCKVNSRESSSGTPKGSPDSTDNPMYGKNQGEVIALPHRQGKDGLSAGVEEYDYAAVHGDGSKYHSVQSKPIYQSLIKDNVQDSVYTSLNKKTPLPEYSYNHLQHPTYNPPHSKDVPSKLLYNKLQKPNDDYLEPGLTINENENGTSEEPVYNVLEDPNANPDLQDSEPVYNVLEDPNSNLVPSQEPLYNVLEDPDDNYDNAPVDDQNHAASGQDNIAYSSNIDLVIPLSPSSPDYDVLEGPEGTLSDPTYQPLSIRTQDDVYQPLDRASQPVYQTLDPNESKV